MGDLNEQQCSAGTTADYTAGSHADGNARTGRSERKVLAEPIWRFRTGLKPASMVELLKAQVIPKIVVALGTLQKPAAHVDASSESSVELFAVLVLGNDDGAAAEHVAREIAHGVSVEAVFLELLAPTARHLGVMWEADTADFAHVTLGVSRLQRIMRTLGESFCDTAYPAVSGETALLTTLPGEQHSFGLSMAAEFFRRAGWNLSMGPFSSHHDLTSMVQDRWFDIVGFSVTSDRRLDELKRDIHDIRRDSRNRNVGIMLGGPMMMTHPEIATSMKADMVSTDASEAPQQARGLVELMKSRP